MTIIDTGHIAATLGFQHCGTAPMRFTSHGVRFEGQFPDGYGIDTYRWTCGCGTTVDLVQREPDNAAGSGQPADTEG